MLVLNIHTQELPQEAKRFARIDKGWTKMMKRAFDTRNVLQVESFMICVELIQTHTHNAQTHMCMSINGSFREL